MEKGFEKCKVCGNETTAFFNINFKKTAICEQCATSIFLQQGKWIADIYMKELKEGGAFRDIAEKMCVGKLNSNG